MKIKLFLLFITILPTLLFAQGPGFGGDGDQVYDVAVPFDNWVLVLVGAVVAYTIYKIIISRKKKKELA